MKRNHFLVIGCFLAGLVACQKTVIEAFEGFRQPTGFPQPAYRLADNPITQQGFELGRSLFYDPILSANNTISCGNCHIQTSGFTQHGHSVSHGINDLLGTRNSPPIMNLAWQPKLMWDGGIFDLDLQPLAPISNHVEMGETMDHVLEKLRQTTKYPGLFRSAFGTEEITTTRFLKALSQFMLMCISDHSKYDSVLRQQAQYTSLEASGYQVFKQHCNRCHTEPLFTDGLFHNNGLTPSAVNDKGRQLVTLSDADAYLFKTPSLRNLQYTAPFMHDGRFFTVDAVLDHYDHGVQAMPTLDTALQTNGTRGIQLTTEERTALLAFLQTLNDRVFLTEKRLSEQ